MTRVKCLVATILLLCTSMFSQVSPTVLAAAGDLGKTIISSQLMSDIFKWITAKPSAQEKARPSVEALYTDLLQLQMIRGALIRDLASRIEEMKSEQSACRDSVTCDTIHSDAVALKDRLTKFQTHVEKLAIALDQQAPNLLETVTTYEASQSKNVDVVIISDDIEALNRSRVRQIHDQLVANTSNFQAILTKYRAFVKQHYPDSLVFVETR